MSISTVDIIVGRIESSTVDSPIAVFNVPGARSGHFDALFGNTFTTKKRIRSEDYLFIGMYHSGTIDAFKTQMKKEGYFNG